MSYGIVAALCFFFFVVLGYLAQLLKLLQRIAQQQRGELSVEQVFAGIFPLREFLSYVAFLLFALSGLTRSYLDYVLVATRLPVIILASMILALLAKHQGKTALNFYRLSWLGNAGFIAVLGSVLAGVSLYQSFFAQSVDLALSAISFALFYGKSRQAVRMYMQQQSAGVSVLREVGVILKDATGLAYALSVGAELYWVGFTHALSIISSGLIVMVKLLPKRIRPA